MLVHVRQLSSPFKLLPGHDYFAREDFCGYIALCMNFLVLHIDSSVRELPSCSISQRGRTALISATLEGHTECVCLLVNGGANMEIEDEVRGAT